MAMFNFTLKIFASARLAKVREEYMSRKNVKLIKEFLKKRKEQQTALTNELAYLKQQRKNKSIDDATYKRLRKVLLLSHEMKHLELLSSVTRQSAKNKGGFKIHLVKQENQTD